MRSKHKRGTRGKDRQTMMDVRQVEAVSGTSNETVMYHVSTPLQVVYVFVEGSEKCR
jgi:hypothetical protein